MSWYVSEEACHRQAAIFESARISANLICEQYEVPYPVVKPLEPVLA
jgi:hypothetical protein